MALVVLVVAAVPMMLDGEPQQGPQHIDVQIPPQPPPDERMPTPSPQLQATPAQPPAAAPDTAPASPESPALPPAPAAARSESTSPPAAAGKAREPAAARAGNGSEAYAVALIATASPAKAAQMKQTLQRLKFPVYTQKTPDGDKTRVRVGPFASREAAEQARQRLVRQGYDPGKVVRQGE